MNVSGTEFEDLAEYQSMDNPRADVPITDRELLLVVFHDVKAIKDKIDGEDGICVILDNHEKDIEALKGWRLWILGGLSVLTFVIIICCDLMFRSL